METTFILAGSFGVTPFEIMKQDVDEVIMIINYLSESGKASKQEDKMLNDKEEANSFWASI